MSPVHATTGISDTYHEGTGDKPLYLDSFLLQCKACLAGNTCQFELARTTEVVHQKHHAIATIILEWQERSLRVGRNGEEFDELGQKIAQRGDR